MYYGKGPRQAPPTLGQMRETSCWLWVICANWKCRHQVPVALAPLIIRWGADASSDDIRRNGRCSKCGHRGCTLQTPSWTGMQTGLQPFPVERP